MQPANGNNPKIPTMCLTADLPRLRIESWVTLPMEVHMRRPHTLYYSLLASVLLLSWSVPVQRAHAVETPGGGAQLLKCATVDLVYSAQSYLSCKYLDEAGGGFKSVCHMPDGVLLADCGEALRKQELAAQRELFGCLTPLLAQQYEQVGDAVGLPVMLWLIVPMMEEDKEALAESPWLGEVYYFSQEALQLPVKAAVSSELDAQGVSDAMPVLHAPVIQGSMTRQQAHALCSSPYVERIYYAPPPQPAWTSYKGTIQTPAGVTGDGSAVCVIESQLYDDDTNLEIDDVFCPGGTTGDHGTWVAGVIRATTTPYGVAPDAIVDYASWEGPGCGSNAGPSIDWCARTQSSPDIDNFVWNFSHTCGDGDQRLFDYWARTFPYPLVAAAAGNQGSNAVVDCQLYNGLVVGGTNDQGDTRRSNDTIYNNTSSLNPDTVHDDWELPYVCAPAVDIEAAGEQKSGTSGASPQVAAAVAVLQEGNSAVVTWPELARALVMVGATENIHGPVLDLGDGTDDRDGAGELSISTSVIVGDETNKVNGGNDPCWMGFDYGAVYESSTPASSYYAESYHASIPYSGRRLRIVLTWDGTGVCTDGDDPTSCSGHFLDADFDLVVKSNGLPVAFSYSYDSPFEFVEFDAEANQTYDIHIWVSSWEASATYFSIAWNFAYYTTN